MLAKGGAAHEESIAWSESLWPDGRPGRVGLAVNFFIPELVEQTSAVLFLAAVIIAAYGGMDRACSPPPCPRLFSITSWSGNLRHRPRPRGLRLDDGVHPGSVLISFLNAVRASSNSCSACKTGQGEEVHPGARSRTAQASPIHRVLTVPWGSAARATPDIQDACAVIDRQVRSVANLVNDLLDVVRINEGKVEDQGHRMEQLRLVSGFKRYGHSSSV